MKVTIHKVEYDYTSNYSNGNAEWKVKLRDAFRIVTIGKHTCFVKRFTSKPSAWDLLQKLKGKTVPSLPRVYDFVSVQESSSTVHYLFLEALQGRTLKETIQKKKSFELQQILPDILTGLQSIHEQGFWFGDLNEENIFCDDNGKYHLIDIDSCWPTSVNPGFDITQPGGLPGAAQEYAHIVANFYEEVLKEQISPYKDLSGVNLNYLQLLALLAKIDFYIGQLLGDSLFNYFDKKKFTSVHNHLFFKNQDYSKGVFTRAIDNSVLPAMILAMGRFITNETILDGGPVIEFFNADTYNIYEGTTVLLRWSVTNAASVIIEPPIPVIPALSGSQVVSPATSSSYKLKAVGHNGKIVTKTFAVQVSVRPKPVIEYFKADKEKVKKGESVNVTWSVKHADSLSMGGMAVSTTSNNKRLTPTASTTYDLVAENQQGQKVTQSLRVRVHQGFGWKAAIACIVLVAIFSLFVLQYVYSAQLDKGDSSFLAEDFDKAAENYGRAEKMELSGLLWKVDAKRPWRLNLDFARKVNLGSEFEAGGNKKAARNAYLEAYNYGSIRGMDSLMLHNIHERYYSMMPPGFEISNVRPKFGVTKDDKTGLEVHVKFDATAMKGDTCVAVVWFYKQSGEPLMDSNGQYCSEGNPGNVCTTQIFIPDYHRATFTDMTLFIPYDELDLPAYGVHQLAFKVGFQWRRKVITTSDKTTFTLTYS